MKNLISSVLSLIILTIALLFAPFSNASNGFNIKKFVDPDFYDIKNLNCFFKHGYKNTVEGNQSHMINLTPIKLDIVINKTKLSALIKYNQKDYERVDRTAHAAGPSLEPHRALLRQWAQDKSVHTVMSRKADGGFLLLAVEIAPQIIGISPS